MRGKLITTATFAVSSMLMGASAAGDPPSGASATPRVTGAAEPATSSKPPRSRPRNPLDRSRTDPGIATFKSFDADNDGYLSREEARESPGLSRQFDRLDKNRDGKLSLHELTGWRNVSYK